MTRTRSRRRIDRHRTIGATILAVALVATACSESETSADQTVPATTVVPPGQSANASLSGVSVDSTTIEELDVLRFSGIDVDGDLSELELQAIVDGAEPMDLLLFVDDGGLYTIFPLHPEHPGSGGDVTLRLSTGEEQASEFDITVTGLPAAPGAWDRAVDTIVQELELRAGQLGTSLAVLADTPVDDLGGDEAVLKLIATYVDNGTASDLESLLVRPGEELPADGVNLVDSIVAKIDPLQLIPAPMDPQFLEAVASGSQEASNGVASRPVTAVRAAYARAGSCQTKVISITSEAELAAAVERGVGAKRSQGGAVDKLTKDVAALAQGLGNAKNGAAVAGAAGPVAGAVAGFVGAVDTMYATMGLWFEADAGNYPTVFTSLTAEASVDTFNEDYLKEGDVSSVSVVAASTGFDASEGFSKVASSAVNGSIGAGVGKLSDGVSAAGGAAVDAGGILRDSIVSETIKYDSQDLEFCGQQWTVVLKSSQYVDVSAVIGRIEVDKASWTYKPLDLGDDILRVRARSDAFSGLTASVDVPIETKRLQVISTPSDITVKRAGDTIDIATELKNADTTTLLWKAEQGTWADGKGEATNDAATRPLETPTKEASYPFAVVVDSTSKTGLRQTATDVRRDLVWVTLQRLIVTPDPGKVRKNQQLQFLATDVDGQSREVIWTATGGTISDTGLYTAGKTPGTYSVTATAVDDPSTSETVAVTIFDGACFIGTWVLRSEDFFTQIGAQFGGAISYRSGENRLIVREDGTYTTVRDAWSYEVASQEGKVVGTITAETSGTWSTTETDLSFDEAGGDEVTVELLIERGGKLVPLPFNAGSTQVPAEAMSGEFPYTCEGDVFTAFSGAVTSVFDRVDS